SDNGAAAPRGRAPRGGRGGPPRWQATGAAVPVGSAAQAAPPADPLPLERLQVIVPALAAVDPLRLHLDPPAVIAAGRALIAGMVDCLPAARPGAAQSLPLVGSIAEGLGAGLGLLDP